VGSAVLLSQKRKPPTKTNARIIRGRESWSADPLRDPKMAITGVPFVY
jgi:hypothetical protein